LPQAAIGFTVGALGTSLPKTSHRRAGAAPAAGDLEVGNLFNSVVAGRWSAWPGVVRWPGSGCRCWPSWSASLLAWLLLRRQHRLTGPEAWLLLRVYLLALPLVPRGGSGSRLSVEADPHAAVLGPSGRVVLAVRPGVGGDRLVLAVTGDLKRHLRVRQQRGERRADSLGAPLRQ
jgi:hypothetical protein